MPVPDVPDSSDDYEDKPPIKSDYLLEKMEDMEKYPESETGFCKPVRMAMVLFAAAAGGAGAGEGAGGGAGGRARGGIHH